MFMEGTNMMGQLFFIEVVVPRKSLTALIDDPSKSLPPPLNASYIFSFIWWAFFLNSFPFSLFLNTSLITLQPPPLISTPIGHGFDPQFIQKISVVCACIFLSSIQKISSCLIVAESTPRATSIQTPTSLSSFWELKHCSLASGQPMIGTPLTQTFKYWVPTTMVEECTCGFVG